MQKGMLIAQLWLETATSEPVTIIGKDTDLLVLLLFVLLQKQYTVEVKNRFEVLEIEEDANERYQRFVEANRQAMESCVPEKEKKKCKSFLRHPEIVRAREMVETATWVVINEITGRKKTIEGQVAGASPEERVKTWYNHFQNLLGSTPETEELEDVDMILAEGNISDDPFSPEEYIKVKISLKQGKSSSPDEIPPEVLKNCDLDNIILDIFVEADEAALIVIYGGIPEKDTRFRRIDSLPRKWLTSNSAKFPSMRVFNGQGRKI
ncbi:hypothetical protein CAPTEDRAFT_198468 [Capitella teleta]|uniref:Uncharacterized protein n=1 Tax=Capitella teleta TaxID=283909 RepID=R7TM43_CAPTE|nr:hypothetical protein CAPTEDRAFT_198468 [Capitella teleta]|eukprot:ELT94719.1 hypothetical protein CAPTEDRAFT_198468 [Capitella teleta]